MATFDEQIKAFQRKAISSVDKNMRDVSIRLFGAVIKTTPVGKYDNGQVGGRLRANWQASGVSAATGQLEMFDKSGNETVAKMAAYIKTAAKANEFTLTNNLPYAPKIEYGGYGDGPKTSGGFSIQAPQGMVRVNVARFQRLLDDAARENG
ncbi:hypothetical protein [Shewanella sp.]|uniref:hypothetical protein n=1 Tax=Shewanella sp. TaxID=50422 RepID=UPI003F3B2B38